MSGIDQLARYVDEQTMCRVTAKSFRSRAENTGIPAAFETKCSSSPPEVPVLVRWDYFSNSRAALVYAFVTSVM
jgi:hypothetical protein